MEFNKNAEGVTILNQREEHEYLRTLMNAEDFIQKLWEVANQDSSPVAQLKDLDVLKAIIDRICEELRLQVDQLQKYSTSKPPEVKYQGELPCESRIRLIIRVLSKVLHLLERRISDANLSRLLLSIVDHSQSHAVVADLFLLIAKANFSSEVDLLYYYIRAYMEHWNSYDNRRLGLDCLLEAPQDLKLVFQQHGKMQELYAKREDLLQLRASGFTIYQIAKQLYPEPQQSADKHYQQILVALITKLRLVLCEPHQLPDLIGCVLRANQLYTLIELHAQRDDSPPVVPDIFIFPPDYESIFIQFFELFLKNNCDMATRVNIVDMGNVILEIENDDNALLIHFGQSMVYFRKLVTDYNNLLHGRPAQILTPEIIKDPRFRQAFLELIVKSSAFLEDARATAFQIGTVLAFETDSDPTSVELASLLSLDCSPNQAAAVGLIDRYVDAICVGPSQHAHIYVEIISTFLAQKSQEDHLQRRDYAAVIRKLVQSNMFPSLQAQLMSLDNIELRFRVMSLILTICSESPLFTDKMKPIIVYLTDQLNNAIPKQINRLTVALNFLYHVCLKEGEVRDYVFGSGVIQYLMQVYVGDDYVKELSGCNCGGGVARFYGMVNRFVGNFSQSKPLFYEGIVNACQKVLAEAKVFEEYLDKLFAGETGLVEPMHYELVAQKVFNIMKLILKIAGNLNLEPTAQLYNLTEAIFRLKYIHFLANNKFGNFVVLMDPTKLQEICREINEIVSNLDLSKFKQFEKKTFPDLIEIAKTDKSACECLKIHMDLGRLDRLLSLARSCSDPTPLFKLFNLFPLIGKLDQMRMRGVDFIKAELAQLTKPLDEKQQRDNLHHLLKSLSQRPSVSMSLQSSLKKLVAEAQRTRDFSVSQHIAECVTQQLQNLLTIPKNNSLTSIFYSRLKLQNIQLMLELPMVMYNRTGFPYPFGLFAYLYTQPVPDLFRAFSELTQEFSLDFVEEDQHIKQFNKLLRNELLKRILLVVEHFHDWGLKGNDPDPQQDNNPDVQDRRGAVRYTALQVVTGLMEMIKSMPRTCHPSSKPLLQSILDSAVVAIEHISQLKDCELGSCTYAFPVDPQKKLSSKAYIHSIVGLNAQFVTWLLDHIEEMQLYDPPIAWLVTNPIPKSHLKDFAVRSCLSVTHTVICSKIILTSKHLFQNYTLDLGIKHPALKHRQFGNVRPLLCQLKTLTTVYIEIIEGLRKHTFYGPGMLSISSNSVCEILRLVTQIMNSADEMAEDGEKPLEEIDGLVKNAVALVEVYGQYEEEEQRERVGSRGEEEDGRQREIGNEGAQKRVKGNKKNKKARHRSVVQISGRKKSGEEQLQAIVAEKSPRKKRKKPPKRHSIIAEALNQMLIAVLNESLAILSNRTMQHIMIFLAENAKKRASKRLRMKLQQIFPLLLKTVLKQPTKTGLDDRLSTLGLKLFTNTQIKVDAEASIKRLLLELQSECKEQWKPLKLIFKDIAITLAESFPKQVVPAFLRICDLQKDGKVVTLTKKQVQELTEAEVEKYKFKLKQGHELHTFRKGSQKKWQNIQFVDYQPDKALQSLLQSIVDQIILSIIHLIDSKFWNCLYAFDFHMLCKVLQVLVRESGILVPFILKTKCSKKIASVLQGCSEETRALVGRLLGKNVHEYEVNFLKVLVQLVGSLSFGKIDRLLFQLCLDSYVLVKVKKGTTHSLGMINRIYILNHGVMRQQTIDDHLLQILANLSMMLNLLDLRQFSSLCLDSRVLSLLHRLFLHIESTRPCEFARRARPFTLNPATILHQLNLEFNSSKQPKFVARGKPTIEQVKDQLISKTSVPHTHFERNWQYSTQDIASILESRESDSEDMDSSLSGSGSMGEHMDMHLMQDEVQLQSGQSGEPEEMEDQDSQSDRHDSGYGWTMSEAMMSEQPDGEQQQQEDEQIEQQGSLTDMFVENFFGSLDQSHSQQSLSNANNNSFYKQIAGSPRMFNPQIRHMLQQVQTLLSQILYQSQPSNANLSPLATGLRNQPTFLIVRRIADQMAFNSENTQFVEPASSIKSLTVTLPDARFIYDEVALYLTHRFRRRAEIQRPGIITANLPGVAGQHGHQHAVEEEEGNEVIEEVNEEEEEPEAVEVEEVVEEEGGLPRETVDMLLMSQGMTVEEFRLLPLDLQQDILNNLANPDQQIIQAEDNQHIQIEDNQQPEPQPEQEQAKEAMVDRRRKLSQDYLKKISRDPREILLKEKRESKLYVCEDEFIVAILKMLYQDETAQTNFPYDLLKALCANPINETKFLSVLMILLKHPNLEQQKQAHGEPPNIFPMTIIQQKNGQLSTDYKYMGYGMLSLKILHILSHLSKTNASSMLQTHHNKVAFLPSWYYLPEKTYLVHLIELLEDQFFMTSAPKTYLLDTIFHIIKHHCLKSSDSSSDDSLLKLSDHQVKLMCSVLEHQVIPEQISQAITYLCLANRSNMATFIRTLYLMVDRFANRLRGEIREGVWDDLQARGKLKQILSIVYDMFQHQFSMRLQILKNRQKVRAQLLSAFKNLVQCKSLQQLCRDCVQKMCLIEIPPAQLGISTEILECFFIIYKITLNQEEESKHNATISALGEIGKKKSIIVEEGKGGEVNRGREFSLEGLFREICMKGKGVVNTVLKQKLSELKKSRKESVFDDPMIYILMKNSSLIDYENKRSIFMTEIKHIKSLSKGHHNTISLVITRQHVLDQSMNQIMSRSAEQLKGKLHIQFQDQQGQDAGGLTRQWFSLLSKQMFNPNYVIFQPSSTGNAYRPSPRSNINQHHLTFFKFVGRIVGKALHDGFIMPAFFTPAFYKHILGQDITYEDLQQQDYEFYKNMVWIKQNDITDFGLDFSYEEDEFGCLRMRELVPNGRNVPVTEENKMEYIQRRCYAKMATAVERQIKAFKEGFNELIPQKLVRIFDSKELELMISGLPTIDIVDLKQNTELVNYQKSDNVIIWFFEVLQSFDSNLRASFLQFVTGTSRLPSDGFKGLRGLNGPQKFNIHKDFDVEKLPRAHTCFNQLDLPNYPTKEILIEKLTIAITEGKEGFGLV